MLVQTRMPCEFVDRLDHFIDTGDRFLDDFGEFDTKLFGVVFCREQLCVGVDGYHGVFDLLRHARGNSLLLNRGDGTFEDATEDAGIAIGGWAWGAQFVDINNDGFDDIYSPNGFLTNTDSKDL